MQQLTSQEERSRLIAFLDEFHGPTNLFAKVNEPYVAAVARVQRLSVPGIVAPAASAAALPGSAPQPPAPDLFARVNRDYDAAVGQRKKVAAGEGSA